MTINIRIGGLLRCCTQTASQLGAYAKEGDTLTCLWCKKPTMIFRNGAWEWRRESEVKSEKKSK